MEKEYTQSVNQLIELGFQPDKTYIVRGLEYDVIGGHSILEIYYIWEEVNTNLGVEYKTSKLKVTNLETNLNYVNQGKSKKNTQISNFKIQNNEVFRIDKDLTIHMKNINWEELFYVSSMFLKPVESNDKITYIKDTFDFLGTHSTTKSKTGKQFSTFNKKFDEKQYKTIKNFKSSFDLRILKDFRYNHTLIFDETNSADSAEKELDNRILKIFVKYYLNPWVYLYIRTKYSWSVFLEVIKSDLVGWYSRNSVYCSELLNLIQILLTEGVLNIESFKHQTLNDYYFLIGYDIITKIYSGENWIPKNNFSRLSSSLTMVEYLNSKNFYNQRYMTNRDILHQVAATKLLKIKSVTVGNNITLNYDFLMFNTQDLMFKIDDMLDNVYDLTINYKGVKLPLGDIKVTSVKILQELVNLKNLTNETKNKHNMKVFDTTNVKFFNKHIQHDVDQKNAVLGVLNNPISIMSGGAGTGKSEVIGEILRQLKQHFPDESQKIKIVTPTGKSAFNLRQRLSGLNLKVQTIHSFLESEFGGSFDTKPLELGDGFQTLQILIIDEFGMVNNKIFLDLLHSFNRSNFFKLILVGDRNQVPPIEYGDILNDFYDLNFFPTFELKTNHRSKEKGAVIIDYANQLLNNQNPEFSDLNAYVSSGGWTDYEVALNFFTNEIESLKKNYVKNVLGGSSNKHQNWENDFYNQFAIITHTNNDVDFINNIFQDIRFRNKNYYRLGWKNTSPTKFKSFQELESLEVSDLEKNVIKKELCRSNFLVHPGEKMIILKNISIEISSVEIDDYWIKKHPNLEDNQEIFFNKYNKKKYLKTYSNFFNGETVYFVRANRHYERVETPINKKIESTENTAGYSQVIIKRLENDVWVEVPVDFEILQRAGLEHWNEFFTVGYAGTIHKYQGSEYNKIYIAINSKTIKYWDIRLFYTAITRAKQNLVILSSKFDDIDLIIENGKKPNNTYIKQNLISLKNQMYKWELNAKLLDYEEPKDFMTTTAMYKLINNLFKTVYDNISGIFEEVYLDIVSGNETSPKINIKALNINYLINTIEKSLVRGWDLDIIDYLKTKPSIMNQNIFEQWCSFVKDRLGLLEFKNR